MENWGCVTYGDAQLFRTPPSHNQRGGRGPSSPARDGPHVVRRPGDDAVVGRPVAQRGLRVLGVQLGAWPGHRVHRRSGRASWRSTSGRPTRWTWGPATHPIRGEVPDVAQAMANFDAITYVKGQSVLHQLIGLHRRATRSSRACSAYFRDHAWGNTVLDDLMAAYGAAAGRDLSDWTAAWLDRAGTDVLALDGRPSAAESPDDQEPRPHRVDIASYAGGRRHAPPGRGHLDRADGCHHGGRAPAR